MNIQNVFLLYDVKLRFNMWEEFDAQIPNT